MFWNEPLCSWQAGKYDESLKHLESLQELNKEDYKIAMNKAVVEFYKSGQTTTGTLKQSLMAMKNQVSGEMWAVILSGCLFTWRTNTELCFFMISCISSVVLSLFFRFTRQRRMLMVWMMLKIVCCTIIKPSSTITWGSSLKPSPLERGSTSFWNHLVRHGALHRV